LEAEVAEPDGASMGLDRLSATAVPGAFELIEAGQLDGDDPAFDRIPLPGSSRAVSDRLGPGELAARWRSLLDRLRGYTKDEVVLDRQPIWVPLIDLYVPPDGASTLSSRRRAKMSGGLKLKVLGAGFGSATAFAFADEITFSATRAAKSLRVQMLLTAVRYVGKGRGSLLRVDVGVPESHVEHQIVDLPEPPAPDLSQPLLWTVLRREHLSGSTDAGSFTWTYTSSQQPKWEVGLGGSVLGSLGGELSLGVEAERSEEISVAFEMPYGKDYVFYTPTGQSPLAPRCALATG
jgi:hypothetical protein